MKLIFIRHADPDYEHDSLTELGFRQAEALGEYLSKKKVDYVFCSPLGRAQDTMKAYLKHIEGQNIPFETKEWLHEFRIQVPHGANRVAWDFLPADLDRSDEDLYSLSRWMDCDSPYHNVAGLKSYVEDTIAKFDALLARHGYVRDGHHYLVKNSNTDVLVFFCHFGIEAFLLSHLMNCSPVSLWQNSCATPSSVTTVYTEERREGHALFRMESYGATTHLEMKGMEPGFSGRFSETYDDPRRHD